MFSLDMPTEDYPIALPHGVVVTVRPLTATVMAAATANLQRWLGAMQDERKLREETSSSADDLPDLADPALYQGMMVSHLAAALARYGIRSWEGVDTPFSPANAERLMAHHVMATAFLTAYQEPLARLHAEGNASAPALNGSSAAGANTAADAARTADVGLTAAAALTG